MLWFSAVVDKFCALLQRFKSAYLYYYFYIYFVNIYIKICTILHVKIAFTVMLFAIDLSVDCKYTSSEKLQLLLEVVLILPLLSIMGKNICA